MPPFVGCKRPRSSSPPSTPKGKKPSLFDTADKPTSSSTVQDNRAFLNSLGDSDSEDSLSDVSSIEFEDVVSQPLSKKRKTEHEDDDDEVGWEDAIKSDGRTQLHAPASGRPLGDLELTLDTSTNTGSLADAYSKRKGPSKIERQTRITTHCMHVQFLLFHNLVRNGWTCDKEVQATLVAQLPPGAKKEIGKWKVASGMEVELQREDVEPSRKGGRDGRKRPKAVDDVRSQREWGKPAERQEKGTPNMSSGDPILRLLRVLAACWKKRFTITMPSLRKQGYKSLAQLKVEVDSFKNDKHDVEEHGECVSNLKDFRKIAKACEGSRDLGEQLFVALIRGLGIEARLVANLQPVGFGWGKSEDAVVKKKKTGRKDQNSDEGDDVSGSDAVETPQSSETPFQSTTGKPKKVPKGKAGAPIELSEGSASEDQEMAGNSDDESVVDVTPSMPRRKPNKIYDHDMSFPTYWVEVVSPITNEVYPVEPFLLNPPVATNPEHLGSFEPRGAKADKAKLVFAYVVAYDSGGCAKDVTIRYLKRHMWPGRTKGVRLPVEKVPIYNKKGKIKHHEEYDWFKTVMSGYRQPHHLRTAVDDLEDAKDLKAVKPEKREKTQGEDTLQGYKSSATYALERHLRREEALRPGATPVKYFTAGKGEKAQEEPVFSREDVLICRTGESWHKEGRQVRSGEHPIKMVPVRAVTLTRKREVEEAERDGGEKLKQGMYSQDQTEYIIPPPIENGIIPRNAYGNMDCFVPSMVPKGAVHIPLRKTMTICKRLGIPYAEAVTGFEFGNKRAVPVITGVVVAAENEDTVIDEWEKDEEERKRKEDAKREKVALATWRKFLMGLRIVERVRDEYGGDADAHLKDELNPFTNQNKVTRTRKEQQNETATGEAANHFGKDTGGGFMLHDEDISGGGFLPDDDEALEEDTSSGAIEIRPNGGGKEEPASDDAELIIENEGAFPKTPFNALRGNAGPPSSMKGSTKDPMHHDPQDPPPPKKRGRPLGSSSKTPNTTIPKMARTTPKTANGHHHLSETEDNQPAPKRTTKPKTPKPISKAMNNSKTNGYDTAEQTVTPMRRASTRKAARQSASAVRSHYFEHSSDGGESSGE